MTPIAAAFPAAGAWTRALGIAQPLIQAPMASVQDARLALAVCEAGGLGSLPCALLDVDGLDSALSRLSASGAAFNVNFFCHRSPPDDAALQSEWQRRWRTVLEPFHRELGLDPGGAPAAAVRRPFDAAMAEVLEAHRPRVVSFHFGLPEPALLARLRAWGACIVSSATTPAEGMWLQRHGADAVIAQGLQAGGHRGHFLGEGLSAQARSSEALPALVRALDVPVIAAGGFCKPAHVRWALEQGAAAVQAGTAFLLCDEAMTHPLHRARLRDPQAPTTLTRLFTGGMARGLHNRLIDTLGPDHPDVPPFPLASMALAPLRSAAEALGRDDFTPLWSGEDRSGCLDAPAREIVRRLLAIDGVEARAPG